MNHSAMNSKNVAPEFSAMSLGISSPESILSNSYGEITNNETINYRTLKPEKGGLFCSKVFGPVKDYECLCGKYKRMKYSGIVCEKCDVEVTTSSVRRERMGHVTLAAPVAHIWFVKSQPSKIATALGVAAKDLTRVVYYQAYIVIDPASSTLDKFQVLSDDEYYSVIDSVGEGVVKFGIGAEGIKDALLSIDIDAEIARLSQECDSTSSKIKKRSLEKRLLFLSNFKLSGNKLDWMIMTYIPVLPPELRPLVPLDSGKFATSDLNDLYRRVINRNNRLKRLMEIGAPGLIIRNEKRMLQYAVDDLFLGSRAKVDDVKKSLTENLKGKNGRFRQNILGKRVDYSGRSVIAVGPNLKLHQCGIPIIMALELFKPFIFAKLMAYGRASSIKACEKLFTIDSPEVLDILKDVVADKMVLLNRAPTLHRLGIQAFEVVLINGKAIQIHPLVCKAFNADFDGDQMAVHVPISIEAQMEARILMISSNNILNPSDGSPIISPTKDVVLGLFYATSIFENQSGNNSLFDCVDDVSIAYEMSQISYNTEVKFKMLNQESGKYEYVQTCAGRVLVYDIAKIPFTTEDFEIFNNKINSKHLSKIVLYLLNKHGQACVVRFCDEVMRFGFKICTESGISFGLDDIKIPSSKADLIKKSFEVVKEAEKQLNSGLITYKEKYNKVTDEWSRCVDSVTADMMKAITHGSDTESVNSVYLMINSGARGSESQLKQMAGMKGLMVKPSGEVIEAPIISNFKEGLNMMEYFNSAHGSRKGISDTALKTANAGYLTRRLVDVAQDVKITEHDCGTKKGITFKPSVVDGKIIKKLSEIVSGRVLSEDAIGADGSVILQSGCIVEPENYDLVDSLHFISVRSAAVCESKKGGICSMCYGKDIARREIASVGEAVGIVAAQSIGEPGTQLTLRTFQMGGISSRSSTKNIMSDADGVVKFLNFKTLTNSEGQIVTMNNNSKISIVSKRGGRIIATYTLPRSAELFVKDGQDVIVWQKIATWNTYTTPILSEFNGFVKYLDMIESISYREKFDENSGSSSKVIVNSSRGGKYLIPRIAIVDSNGRTLSHENEAEVFYALPVDCVVQVEDGARISVGDSIAKVQTDVSVIQDITGGLPIVEGIFEARVPTKPSMIAPFDGVAFIDVSPRLKTKIEIRPFDETLEPVEFLIKKGEYLKIDNGQTVSKGDTIIDGEIDLHDVLKTHGEEELIRFMTNKVQSVYQLQGVGINERHIEIIIKRMLSRCIILDAGDSKMVAGENVSMEAVGSKNEELLSLGKRLIEFEKVLTGITKVSVNTDSFLASAAFQEVVKVLSSAACYGKTDNLSGCKENITVGRLIPLGTGFSEANILKS